MKTTKFQKDGNRLRLMVDWAFEDRGESNRTQETVLGSADVLSQVPTILVLKEATIYILWHLGVWININRRHDKRQTLYDTRTNLPSARIGMTV